MRIESDYDAQYEINYVPQPKQRQLHECPANEILYGGAAGPGKSHAIRHEGLKWALLIPGLHVYLFRRTYNELEDNHVIPSQEQWPGIGTYLDGKKRWVFPNGSFIRFCHAQHEKDIFIYQGAEIHLLLVDELTTFTEFQYDYLRGRVRCALDIPQRYRHKIPGIVCGTNPGGIGHEFVKRRWVDFIQAGQTLRRAPRAEGGMLRAYIRGRLEDNPILVERDPGYIDRLDALPEPYRTAYKEGDWDIFMGQAFAFNRAHHVIKPVPVPDEVPLYMTFDWGFGKPYSIAWWWHDDDSGRVYRFAELYGCATGQVDVGVRQEDRTIARQIKRRERELGIEGRHITRICDPTCFNRKPNYQGGGQGPSTADEFAAEGLQLIPGDPNRILKIRQMHKYLALPHPDKPFGEDNVPLLRIYDCCEAFIRTMPVLQADEDNPEDIDSKSEDHPYDEACLLLMHLNPHNKLVSRIKRRKL